MISRTTIPYDSSPLSLVWMGNELKDWVGKGRIYTLNGESKGVGNGRQYKFDAVIQSDNGVYTFIYEKLGTKGVLLKNDKVLREVNRSYYFADTTEYPIAFVKVNGEYAIIHCPDEYNKIEIDSVETGTRITQTTDREEPVDCFHSRFRVNASNTKLLSTGWVWHPMDITELFDIQAALNDNSLFDNSLSTANINMADVCSAEFLTDDLVVISIFKDHKEPVHQIGLFSIAKDEFVKLSDVGFQVGTLIPIDENHVIDLFQHPKLMDLNTGEVLQRFEDINSGTQTSSRVYEPVPPIAVDIVNKRIAIGNGNHIELLTFG